MDIRMSKEGKSSLSTPFDDSTQSSTSNTDDNCKITNNFSAMLALRQEDYALFQAIKEHNLTAVQNALDNGADNLLVNDPDPELDQATPMHLAVRGTGEQCIPILNLLLNTAEQRHQKETVIKARDKDGSTLMHWAIDEGDNSTLSWLVKVAGLDVNIPDQEGFTAFDWAVHYQRKDMMRHLANELGASVSTMAYNSMDQDVNALAYSLEHNQQATNYTSAMTAVNTSPPSPLKLQETAFLEQQQALEKKQNHILRIEKLKLNREIFDSNARRAYTPPHDNITTLATSLSNAIIYKLKQQSDIVKNTTEKMDTRIIVLRSIMAFSNIIPEITISPTSLSATVKLGEAVKEEAKLAEEVTTRNKQVNATNAVNAFSSVSDAQILLFFNQVVEPVSTIIVRNYEDQLLRLNAQSRQLFVTHATNRIFNALSNDTFDQVHSPIVAPIDRILSALHYGNGDCSLRLENHSWADENRRRWSLHSMLTKTRIKIAPTGGISNDGKDAKDEVFAPEKDHSDKYGERWGTPTEARKLGYTCHSNRTTADQVRERNTQQQCIIA